MIPKANAINDLRIPVDVIAGDATSALIQALDLATLIDSRQYFPPYQSVPVVRTASVLRQPAIARALAALAGRVSETDMRRLNAAVDIERRDVKDVVANFSNSSRSYLYV